MLKKYVFFLLLLPLLTFSQEKESHKNSTFFIRPEFLTGKTANANDKFPDTDLLTALFVNIGNYNDAKSQEWAYRLKYPKTGITLGAIDLGNRDDLGRAITLMPYASFGLFQKRTDKLNVLVGMGATYFDTQYDINTNRFNKAITTKATWAFRSFLYYDLINSKKVDWKVGLGYLHHSNGHTRLPNQGLNSFLVSVSPEFKISKKINSEQPALTDHEVHQRNTYNYITTRFGIGQNVLSQIFNDKKEVYSFAASYGKVINKTFKFGAGFYYRFYEHYYDYINNNEALVQEQYSIFRTNPFGYATNFGLFGTGEIMLNHVGLEFQLGVNIYKPLYKVDWMLNEGFTYIEDTPEGPVIRSTLGELDWYYEVKRTISSRMGLKCYAIGTDKAPKHNLFLGAHINANLGQADFTELSLGYVYSFNYK